MDKPEENMINAGIIFMFTAWIQGQMSDLIIFKNNPDLIQPFIASPKVIPTPFSKIRVSYWEKQFGSVKNEFKALFDSELTESEKKDIEEIYHLRNMIAHAHVSVARDYMLYRPFGGSNREQKLIADLNLKQVENQSDPMVVKIELWKKDQFSRASALVERLDQVTLSKISSLLGVPHGRIR